jgi:HSP20 family protein
MAIKDLVPWSDRRREVSGRRDEDPHPILCLHREMNRLFDDVFRGFDPCRDKQIRLTRRMPSWTR